VSGFLAEERHECSEDTYGIPRENVIGSLVQYEYRQPPGCAMLGRMPRGFRRSGGDHAYRSL